MLPGGAAAHRYYELCVLSEPCDRLRTGDVWVAAADNKADFESSMAGRRTLLDERLPVVDQSDSV